MPVTIAFALLLLVLAWSFTLPAASAQENLLNNPTFQGAETSIPPAGWQLYGSLANGHKISIVNAEDWDTRALLIEDVLNQRGQEAEIGLMQTVSAGPGMYKVTARIGAVEGAPPHGIYVQLRFLPSGQREQILALPTDTSGFEEFVVQGTAPQGTTSVRVYLYTPDLAAPQVRVRSVTLTPVPVSENMPYELELIPDHPDYLYEIGETAQFTVRVLQGGLPAQRGGVQWSLQDQEGNRLSSGVALLQNGEYRFSGRLNEPGFLRANVTVLGPGGEAHSTIVVGFSPDKIQVSRPAPDDFDEFWAAKKAELAKVEPVATLTPVSSGRPGIEAFDVRVASLGDVPVSGYFAKPANAQPGTLPAIITLHGAGVRSANLALAVGWASEGLLPMDVNAHGIPNGMPDSYYEQLAETDLKDYRMFGNESRDDFYFLYMFLRVVRAIDFITSQPEWDGKTLILYGTSQGGAQAIAGAGLDERVTFVSAGVPWMSDFGGVLRNYPIHTNLTAMPADQANRIRRTLQYFDVAYFAARMKADAIFTVGFLDPTCPPSTVYAAKNAVPGKTQIHIDPLAGHVNTPEAVRAMRNAILQHIAENRAK